MKADSRTDAPAAAVEYPPSPPRPKRESIGGIVFDDPFAWLEDDSPETLEWQHRQDKLAAEHLRSWSGFTRLRAAVEPHLADAFLFAPLRRGGRWFSLRLGESGPQLRVANAPADEGTVLIDAGELAEEGTPVSLDWFFPSPNGRYVAYGLSWGGDEQSVLHVLDVNTGEALPERVDFTSIAYVAWLPDSSGFYYNGGHAPDWEDADKEIFFHRLGETQRSDPEPITVREAYCVTPQASPDGRFLVAVTSELDPRADLIKELPDGEWRPFLVDLPGRGSGVFVGDEYIAVSTDDAPNGRLIAVPIATAEDRSTWRELMREESDAVVISVEGVGDRLVVTRLVNTYAELRILDVDGRVLDEVELPGEGAVSQFALIGHYQVPSPWPGGNISPGEGDFTFVFSTLTRSPAVYRYDLDARSLEELRAPAFSHDDFVTRDATAIAPDGAMVRYTLVYRDDLDMSQPQPALIYAYGGFNISFVPAYLGCFAPFVEAGGLFVFAHLRGGGEFGTRFWHDGRLEHKQHTFDDLYAVADHLRDSGLTTSDQLGVVGASNGGVLTGAAVTQRPELWRAVASLVPLYDLLKYRRDSYAASCDIEYGDERDPEQAAYLYRWSPYHNVREPGAYPATLIYAGANDMRCRVWHSRKLAARLQNANTSEGPVLLRAREGAGHLTVALDPDQAAEWLGFLLRELGLEPPPT